MFRLNIRYVNSSISAHIHPLLATKMSKRSITDFFAKKPAPEPLQAHSPSDKDNAVETAGPSAEEPAAKKLKVVENSQKENVPEDDSGKPSSSLTDADRQRIENNRQIALSRQYVRKAQDLVAEADQAGKKPALRSLMVDPGWTKALGGEFDKPYMSKLQDFLESEWRGSTAIFPPPAFIFRAFNACPLDRVKVVIIGQDPYHDVGQAMGLCFSVPQGIKTPPSLQNMYKELKSDLGTFNIPSHGNLEKWTFQGVFLLNTVLTVRAHQANSHAKKGWETFTDAAIKTISQQTSGVVFLLWGKQAQDKQSLIDKKKHHVLIAPHPSGLSAHRGFFGCKHFSQCNELLRKQGKGEIDWNL